MAQRVVFRDELRAGQEPPAPRTATCLVDLGLPCHVACTACWRGGLVSPGGLAAARSLLLSAASAAPPGRLRAVFFGGDVFTVPHAFTALLADAEAACDEHGRDFDAIVFSDGVSWTPQVVRELVRRRVRLVQVVLEGTRQLHDRVRPLAGGGGSFDPILASLRDHRGALPVVVRMNALPGEGEVGALAEALEREGLFAEPNPVQLYVAPPAPYRQQVLELLELVDRAPPASGESA